MTKTLIVSYTPRDDSDTLKILEAFKENSTSEIEHLDLVSTPPPLLLKDNLNALLKRNFMGLELTPEEHVCVSENDAYMQQVLDAERIVIAFPMYNFSLPATVKAWVDSVVQKDRTFGIDAEGNYFGLCQGKKALILLTTGADYSEEPYKSMNFASPLMEACFGFMGVESHTIIAPGLNQYPDRVDEIVKQAQGEVVNFLKSDNGW